jgi:hypothetical protein
MRIDETQTGAVQRMQLDELENFWVSRDGYNREVAEQRKHGRAITQRSEHQLTNDHGIYANLDRADHPGLG